MITAGIPIGARRIWRRDSPRRNPEIVRDAAQRAAEAETPPLAAPITGIARPSSRAITFTPRTATSGTSRTCSPTTPIGRSAISASRPGTGGPGKIVELSPYAVKDIDCFGERVEQEGHPRTGEIGSRLGTR